MILFVKHVKTLYTSGIRKKFEEFFPYIINLSGGTLECGIPPHPKVLKLPLFLWKGFSGEILWKLHK
ncbi:MAG TPA: hypothetical protein O0X73_02555 [Methanocorpusculum sp.]|nr:hypothetical protein [Methanocorpusculum sp.]